MLTNNTRVMNCYIKTISVTYGTSKQKVLVILTCFIIIIFQKANSTKRMNCYIKPILGTYGTSKQEVLSVKPRIVLIYDVLDTKETNVLLKYTGKQVTALVY